LFNTPKSKAVLASVHIFPVFYGVASLGRCAQLEREAAPVRTSTPTGFFAKRRFADMPKPTKHFEREVRRVRHLSAWITVQDGATSECQVMDISNNGAKIVSAMSSTLPKRFQLAFRKAARREAAKLFVGTEGCWA
jgi:hypothetical protein